MVLTSVAVPASAEAATKGEVTVKGSAVSSKTVWAGGKSVNFDYKYGKKTSGIKGVWTSNNANIVVNPTSGKVTATGKADGTVTFTPDSKKYGKITVAVKARVRATGLFVREDDKNGQVVSEASVKVGETKKFYVSMSTKLHVKSTYFTHVSASTTAASVTNGANGTSYAGANYGRELTVTGLATGTSVINVSATPYTDDRTSNYDPTPVTLTVKVGEEKIDNKFESGAKQIGAKKIEAVLDTTTMTATNPGVFLVRDDAPNTIIRFEKVTIGNNNVVFDLVMTGDVTLGRIQNSFIEGYYCVTDSSDVSKYHCSLKRNDDGSVLITDLNSTNHTYVNGIRIEGTSVLRRGDAGNARFLQLRAVEIAGREQAPDLIVDLGQLQFIDLHDDFSIT